MDNSKLSRHSEESKGFIDNEVINKDGNDSRQEDGIDEGMKKDNYEEVEIEIDNSGLMNSNDNDNPTLLPDNETSSEAHRKLKQENFIDIEQDLYEDHDDKIIKDFEKQLRNSRSTFYDDKNNKQHLKDKGDNARKDTNATSHQDFQSNIFTKKLEDNKGDHAEEDAKADPESHFKLSSESYNNFDNLQYGSQIMINIEGEDKNLFRKLSTKLRISEK